jgi:hypothetical protein
MFISKSKINDVCATLAERIESIRPSGTILLNTIKGGYRKAYNEGYHRHLREAARLRRRRDKTSVQDWLEQKTLIDDMIHGHKPALNESM